MPKPPKPRTRVDLDEFKRVAIETQSLAETARRFGFSKNRAHQLAQRCGLKFLLVPVGFAKPSPLTEL